MEGSGLSYRKRSRDCGDGIQSSDAHSEGYCDGLFGSKGFSDAGYLEQNQGQQHEVGHKLDSGRMNEGKNITADSYADQEADQNGRHALPNVRNALAVDEEDIAIDHQFHED
jgi:hypothetical protein